MKTLLKEALFYAHLNFNVFPLNVNSKSRQVVPSWLNDATTDIETIKKWFSNTDYNVGVRTGNGLMVIDVDNKNGKNGKESIRPYLQKFPKTLVVKTPNNGWHLYYYVDREIANAVNIYDGVDIRGEHGYVVGVGSKTEDGVYTIGSNYPIAHANEAVYEFLKQSKQAKEKKIDLSVVNNQILEGNRNDAMFKLATALKGKGMSHNAILLAVKEENHTKCVPPLDEKEIETICNSVERQFEKREKQNYHPDDELSTYLKSVDEIEAKELEWIVEDLIPKNQVTIFAGDGGVGKTSVWVHIVAKLSKGEPLFFEKETNRKPMKIIYFSGEDPTSVILKKKILDNDGNIKNIRTIDVDDERLQRIRFDTRFLKNVIQDNRPDIVVFDPLQSFLPEHTNMSARNQMRDAMNHLLYLARHYEVTFLVMVHTNKKSNVSGRERAADSADIWDISRSFFFRRRDK